MHSLINTNPAATLPMMLIAQDNQAAPAAGGAPTPTAGDASAGTSKTVAPDSATGNSGTGPTRPGGIEPLFLMVMLVVLGMIVFSMMGQKRDRKKREAMISAIKKHDRVQTIGGVIGSVVEIKPDYVVLKVDESSNTRITFSRSAIASVLSASPEPAGAGRPEQATS